MAARRMRHSRNGARNAAADDILRGLESVADTADTTAGGAADTGVFDATSGNRRGHNRSSTGVRTNGVSSGGGRFAGRAFTKDMLRSWLGSWKRFASIAAISLLGVTVLTGIYGGCRDMFNAADRFYDAQGLHDIQVLSTYGLTDDDVAALAQVEGVDVVQPERTQSVETEVDGTLKSVTMTEIGVAGLDQPYLQEGEMPDEAGEVAVTEKFLLDSGLEIGDTITVIPVDEDSTIAGLDFDDEDTDDEDVDDIASTSDSVDSAESSPSFPTELTITAQVLDPSDLTNPDGYATSTVRSPTTADYVFFAPSDGVTGDVYTAISLTVEGAADLDTFGDDYDALVDEVADRIENTVQNVRQVARRDAIVAEAQERLDQAEADAVEQLDDAQQQIDDQRETLETSRQAIADNLEQLEAAQAEIASGETQIADAREQIASGRAQIADGRQQIADARAELQSGQQQLADARAQLDAAQDELDAQQAEIDAGYGQIEALPTLTQVRDLIDQLPDTDIDQETWETIAQLLISAGIPVDPSTPPSDGFTSLVTQLDDAIAQMQAAQTQLDDAQQQLDAAQDELDANDAQLTAQEDEAAEAAAELDAQSAQLESQSAALETQAAELESQAATLAASKQEVDDGLAQIDEAQTQLEDGETQIDEAQTELDEQRQQVEDEIARQQQAIDDVAAATWYVQDRSSIGGFSSLDSDVSSIESLGFAFPVVFLLVALLMSLTTMTRMVEEERGLIGTYTGLGYSNVTIAMRYVLFAVLACLIGGGLGLLVGFLGIPAILLVVLQNMYVIPGIRLEYDWPYGTMGILLFVVVVLAATVAACVGVLRQMPAELMRPKSPKVGSRVLLERIRPLWSRLGFLNKVTVRNIFRFKSRLVMTVGGVAGCTALIVCGLAINDSVDVLGSKQYQDIYQYDVMVVAGDANADDMAELVTGDADVTDAMRLRLESGELQGDDAGSSVQLLVVPDGSEREFGDMISLQNVDDGDAAIELADDAVIVAQSAAASLGIEAGDTVTIVDGNMRHGEVTVDAIARGIIGSDVYIGEEAYRRAFDDDAPLTLNAVLAMYDGTDDEQVAYAEELQHESSVVSAVSCVDMDRSFTFDLMGAVVALIVALAGGLALVVLFTLSNTNVSERVREMATLKVLGFTDREVHTYVNKEMLILTGMGIVVGLPLGRFVGGMLTSALNMPGIYFEVEVRWWSYLIAAAVTLVFALLVQLLTNPVLDRIDPVSSLKSVE